MGPRVLAALAALLFAGAASAQQLERRGAVDWIFLIDTSASMRGAGGAKNIFESVKASIHTFIGAAKDGDSITIFSFDRGVDFKGYSTIGGAFDRDEMHKIVNALEANGDRTHLGLAIKTGLERAENFLNRGDKTRERSIVLFTDGRESVEGIPNPIPIPSKVKRIQESRPWIFFVSMGDHDPQIDALASDPAVGGRAKVLRPTDPESIQRAGQDIRQQMEARRAVPPPPPPPPQPASIATAPVELNFGDVKEGETAQRVLTLRSDKPARVSVKLATTEGVTFRPVPDVTVGPDEPVPVTVALTAGNDADAGAKRMTLHIAAAAGETRRVTPAAVPVTLTIPPPPVWVRVLRWALLALLAIVLIVAALALRRGTTPTGLLRSLREREHLEGELEILKPPTADPYVGLPALNASETPLSAIVPRGAASGGDARLLCRRRDGEKTMWIVRQSGTLRVNEVEVAEVELFDSDIIEVEGTKLRFNWNGHDRPSAADEFSVS